MITTIFQAYFKLIDSDGSTSRIIRGHLKTSLKQTNCPLQCPFWLTVHFREQTFSFVSFPKNPLKALLIKIFVFLIIH